MTRRSRASPVVLAVAGLALLANPLYVRRAVGPTAGFSLIEQYFAAVAGLGSLAIVAAIAIATDAGRRLGADRSIVAVALAAVVAFLPYAWLVAGRVLPDVAGVFGPDLVVSVAAAVAALFVVGAAVATGRSRALLGLIPLVALGVAAGIVGEGDALAALRTVGALVVLSWIVVPGDGVLCYVAALVLGALYGRAIREPAPGSGPTPESVDAAG